MPKHVRAYGYVRFPIICLFGSALLAALVASLTTMRSCAGLMQGTTEFGTFPAKPQYGKYVDTYTHYIPAPVEDYVVENAEALGYNTTGNYRAAGCTIWRESNASNPKIFNSLQTYLQELQDYNSRLKKFTAVPDLRLRLDDPDICKSVELHPDGLEGIFRSGQISRSSSGYVEPLLPPLRHPEYCFGKHLQDHLFDLTWLVHDFGAMCRKLKKTSRTVLIDMGASLRFDGIDFEPAFYLTEVFEKFGFPFDHIYAYEVTKQDPDTVFELVPEKLQAAYHWINVPVDPTEGARMNPFTMLLNKYNKDDFIIVKLDVDTPAVELALARQLLKDDRLGEMVDHFYFEHHVHLKELAWTWRSSMEGSVKESLDLFSDLRRKGIPAHYWP